jgi:hypothetical protein
MSCMRRSCLWVPLICWLATVLPVAAATGRVIKVLPHFLDRQGHHSLSPNLYERDAYQAYLRKNPKLCSGLRFDLQWKTKGPAMGILKLKVELRGVAQGNSPKELVLEQTVESRGRFSHWTGIVLRGSQYTDFGEVTAWRVTLWDGAQLLGEQKSFLW